MGSVTKRRSGRLKFFVTSSRKLTSISSCLAWIPQFLVRRRSTSAFCTRTIGGYDSSRKITLSPKAMKPIIAAMYSVQRQPMCLFNTINPPRNGARSGPVKTIIENTVIARPRLLLSNISEKTAATTARGQEPNTPPKNRQIKTVCRSFPTAVPIEKIEKPNIAMVRGSFLPLSSESGAQRIGPVAKPSTYRDTPSTPTSILTWYCLATAPVAEEKILLVKAATRVV